VILFGAYAFADGVLAIVTALRRHGASDSWWLLSPSPGSVCGFGG
jgi:uncharacterized membrane protein HdeD (DUF308 family)